MDPENNWRDHVPLWLAGMGTVALVLLALWLAEDRIRTWLWSRGL